MLVAIFFAAPSVAALITARKVFDFVKEKRQAKRAAQDAATVGELGDEITPSLEGAPKTEQTRCE